jgi:hypothetical protein
MVTQNRFQNYATRQVRLVTNIESNVLNFDCDTGINWQAWIFSNEAGDKSTLVTFRISGSFGTVGEIQTRIGGGNVGGDIITGTGPCKVFATGNGNNLLSIWFTPEQTSTALPPKSQEKTLAAIGSVFQVGYAPFRRYLVALLSADPFDLIFRDDSNAIVYTENLNPTNDRAFMTRIVHPTNCTMELVSTVLNQKFIVNHYI